MPTIAEPPEIQCADVESLVGVVLNAFDSPCKRGITPIAVNVIRVAFVTSSTPPRQQQAPNGMTGQEPRGTKRIATA
jgi:hypothetical protein